MEKIHCEKLILGAGIIGLAVADRLADSGTLLIDANSSFGQEISSRNSEVIHSGIYYPPSSLKTLLCIEGRERLYALLNQHNLPFQKCGKLVVATSEEEKDPLYRIALHAQELKVPCLLWSPAEAAFEEPLVRARYCLFFPESGIVDSHRLMAFLESRAQQRGVSIAYRSRLMSIHRGPGGWEATVASPQGIFAIESRTVVNAMGLAAAHWSNEALTTRRYEHRFCRGRYFSLSGNYQKRFRHLVYPLPHKDGLGVHVTLDLEGQARLGPDIDWCPSSDWNDTSPYYQCDWDSLREPFATMAQRYLPSVRSEELSAGLIGIRPKLYVDGRAHSDFLLENHQGWVHALGIESPGLTACLAIAEKVASLI